MRDATNIKEVTIEVEGKKGKIDSFWIMPSTNQVYVKVKHGSVYCNYRLTKLSDEMTVKTRPGFDE